MMSATQTTSQKHILKIGLAVSDGVRFLLVRKKGAFRFILPGGKPEKGESDFQTLRREIEEELGCGLENGTIEFLGDFTDVAADMAGTTVTVRLYKGRLEGQPTPKSEIETLRWIGSGEDDGLLAPSLRNQILPFLFSRERSNENRRLT